MKIRGWKGIVDSEVRPAGLFLLRTKKSHSMKHEMLPPN